MTGNCHFGPELLTIYGSLGKPTGEGGPWKNTSVQAGIPSDPYLIGFYDEKSLEISHSSDQPVAFTIQVDPSGHGPWMDYKTIELTPGETFNFEFPEHFSARWIRIVSAKNCTATAWLVYQ